MDLMRRKLGSRSVFFADIARRIFPISLSHHFLRSVFVKHNARTKTAM